MNPLRPSAKQVESYLKKWDSLDSYVFQESSLRKLFSVIYPLNKEMDDVLIKVCALNTFYSTNIFSPYKVAKHIVSLKIDKKLNDGDLSLVNEIADVKVKKNKRINFYSFATKYCSHHKPMLYPIYDSFIEKMLLYFQETHEFSDFHYDDLRQYPLYRDILFQFQKHYGLEKYNFKQIDKYLWQAGKKYFPRKY